MNTLSSIEPEGFLRTQNLVNFVPRNQDCSWPTQERVVPRVGFLFGAFGPVAGATSIKDKKPTTCDNPRLKLILW